MHFSEVVRGMEHRDGVWTAQVPEEWTQGRSLFGGLQAALAARAMRALVPLAPLRSLQVAFVAPVPAGAVAVEARLLRAGKSVSQVEARIVAGGQTLCLVLGVYGMPRSSQAQLLPAPAAVPEAAPIALPAVPGISPGGAVPAPFELPFVPGLSPSFTQYFKARYLFGGLAMSGSRETRQVIDLDLIDADGPVDETHVLAFADYIPPIALNMVDQFVAGSSVSWMIEFLRDRYDDLGLAGWRVDAQLNAARDGYTNQQLTLWGPGGVPVALSRQSMVVFG